MQSLIQANKYQKFTSMNILIEFFDLINFACYMSQEDAHIVNPQFDNGIGLFAVFDGHGGIECAKFCERFFPDKLRE